MCKVMKISFIGLLLCTIGLYGDDANLLKAAIKRAKAFVAPPMSDSVNLPQVQDKIANVQLEFLDKNSDTVAKIGFPGVKYDIVSADASVTAVYDSTAGTVFGTLTLGSQAINGIVLSDAISKDKVPVRAEALVYSPSGKILVKPAVWLTNKIVSS